jgi:hypothetical protein
MSEKKNPLDKLSKDDKLRLSRGTYMIAGLGNFLRWTASFNQFEISQHPNHRSVKVLSMLQSGRFALAFTDHEAILGVQQNESPWMKDIPFDHAIVDDRLYLTMPEIEVMNIKFPSMTIGITIESSNKLIKLASMKFLRFMSIEVRNGVVVDVINELREPISIAAMLVSEGLTLKDRENSENITYNDFL